MNTCSHNDDKLRRWSGETCRVPIPSGRDPFVNTPLLALGPGEDGCERFWISTWNANVGCLAAVVTEAGEARIHRFDDKRYPGFYSAVQEDKDTLWLCGNLSRVIRFTLSTGEIKEYPTGAPPALVFQGMALDHKSGKLFAAAFPPPEIVAFSFDIRRKKNVKLHSAFSDQHYMRCSFPNGDGTYSFVLHVPGETLLRWDPRIESLETLKIWDERRSDGGTTFSLIGDERGRMYFPGRGWYDPHGREFSKDGPLPDRELTWFRRSGVYAWGGEREDGNLKVGCWDMMSGEVDMLCNIPDCNIHNVNATPGGKIVAVNMYGFFFRFDGRTGALEMTRRLPADSVCRVDCLCRIDEQRLLGTPFITQRFWEANLETKEGCDCGRAAPGSGEILKTWKMGDNVYMAAYTGGKLVEYDPQEHPHFPENPCVVAEPPRAMRPVSGADDGRNIYYACSAPYGKLGSTLTRYDTISGAAEYEVNPLPQQQIVSMFFDQPTGSLICGTTMHADCRSCPPSSHCCFFARIHAESLKVVEKLAAPNGATRALVEGPLDEGKYLCRCVGKEDVWFEFDSAAFELPDRGEMQPLPQNTEMLLYAGRPGYFVLKRGRRVELWDMRENKPVIRFAEEFDGYSVKIDAGSLYLIHPREIEIIDNFWEVIYDHGHS